MQIIGRTKSLLRNLFRRKHAEADLDAELRSYTDLLTDENRARGLAPAEARRQAQIDSGGFEQLKENVREARAGHHIETFWRDLLLAFRNIRRNPVFTLIVVLSLALGIGANAAIFSIADALILRPLPVPNAGEVIVVDTAASKLSRYGGSSYLDYIDFHARSKSFQSLAISQQLSAGMNTSAAAPDSKPENVYGAMVSGNLLSTLQVKPIVGRDFLPTEDIVPDKFPVAIISYSLWNRVFAKDPAIVGKQIQLNGHSFTIVGVTPQSFTGTDLFSRPEIFVPNMMSAEVTADGADILKQRTYRNYAMFGRLNPGVTVAEAQAEMNVIMSGLEREHPETNKDSVVIVRTELGRRMETSLVAVPSLLGALVVLVLIMACANVASLLMARATSRLKETSTRIALGASRARLVRQFLTESTVLAALGGAAGTLLAYGCIRGFQALMPLTEKPEGPDFRLDMRTLVCVAIVSAIAVLLFGLAPAFMAVKEAWSAVMTTRSAASASRSFSAVARRVLIGGQIALSVVLLMVGGLFLKSFSRAQNVGVGFNPNHLLLVTIDPLLQGYSTTQSSQFHEQLLQRVSALPGVTSATVTAKAPFLAEDSWDLSIDGYTAPGGEKFQDVITSEVDPKYFSTMQIPILYGREFAVTDTKKSPLVAVVNETLVRNFITGSGDMSKALGHIIRLRDNLPIQIVGISKDSSVGDQLGTPPPAVFYLPYVQQGSSKATLVVRSEAEPVVTLPAIRSEIAALDANISPVSVYKMTDLISQQGLFFPRIVAVLGGAFGFVAMSLAAVGLYGVVSFMVGRRTQEIGIRMTLGAQRGDVLRMVLANGLILAASGLLVGLAISLIAAPAVRSMLVGVSPYDPATFIEITAVLLAVTAVASFLPAARATRVDPILALRHE
ncbi:MAG TPA: ABC transporter permease [Candidatus Acidoferrum sp.]